MMKLQFQYVLLLIAILLSGCQSNQIEHDFAKYLLTKDVNLRIKLVPNANPDDPVYHDDGTISLILKNISQDLIRFPVDFGIRMYTVNKESKQWEEVRNGEYYQITAVGMNLESAKRKLELEGGYPLYPVSSNIEEISSEPITASPVLDGYELPLTLRLVVTGRVFRDDKPTDELISAYYDVEINSYQPCSPPSNVSGGDVNCK